MTVIFSPCSMPGLMSTRCPLGDPGAVGSENPRLRHGGPAAPDPEVEMVERGGAKLDEHLVRARLGIGRVLVAENLGPAVLVDPDCLHFRRS